MIKKIGNGLYKPKLIRNSNIEIKSMSKYTGYGVFALDLIESDTIIEECVLPIETIPKHYPVFLNYRFMGEKKDKDWNYVLPLGIAAVLNNSENPNCIIKQNLEYERILIIKTIKQVLPGEELTHNYYIKK